jgi:hypothetical protein
MGWLFASAITRRPTRSNGRAPDLIQGAQVMAVAALRIANLDRLLPRDK